MVQTYIVADPYSSKILQEQKRIGELKQGNRESGNGPPAGVLPICPYKKQMNLINNEFNKAFPNF